MACQCVNNKPYFCFQLYFMKHKICIGKICINSFKVTAIEKANLKYRSTKSAHESVLFFHVIIHTCKCCNAQSLKNNLFQKSNIRCITFVASGKVNQAECTSCLKAN